MYLDSSMNISSVISVNPVSKTLATLHPEAVASFVMERTSSMRSNIEMRESREYNSDRSDRWATLVRRFFASFGPRR